MSSLAGDSVDVRQFDLRQSITGGVPGTPGYLEVKPGSYRYVSWWSSWPLNPDVALAARLQFKPSLVFPLVSSFFNFPLGSVYAVNLYNPVPASGNLCASGVYLVTVAFHNVELHPCVNQLPFAWRTHITVGAGLVVTLGWGLDASASASPSTLMPTGYAPFSKLRVIAPPHAGLVTSIRWRPGTTTETFVTTVTHNPPALESADLILDNTAGGAFTDDVTVEFSNSV